VTALIAVAGIGAPTVTGIIDLTLRFRTP